MKLVFPRLAVVLCAALLAASPALRAQSVADIPAGARVRVAEPGSGQFTATFSEVRGDSLFVVSGAGENARVVALSVSSLHRLQVSRGRASRPASALRGAAIGLVGGAAAGAAGAMLGNMAASECEDFPDDLPCFTTGEAALFGVILGAPFGAAWGAVTGFLLPEERWRSLPLRSAPGVTLGAGGDGVRLGLSFPAP